MTIRVVEEAPTPAVLAAYGTVPAAFTVRRRMHIVERQGRYVLEEAPVSPAWIKDYDRDAGPPSRLATRWDLSTWGILAAYEAARRVGGALVAWNTAGLDMLADRTDLAAVWDLRVHPDHRRAGVGRHLWDAAAAWARARGCLHLHVETQDVNVPACRFYAGRGCTLCRVEPGAYPELPGEVRLIWSLALPPHPGTRRAG